jgi:hypothetical protein
MNMKHFSETAGSQLPAACPGGLRAMARAALMCALLLPAPALLAQEITAAERLLFQSSHLGNVTPPSVLRYDYVRRGRDGAGFSDEVLIDVSARNSDGSAAVSSRFLHGERQLPIPPVQDAQGNPALLGFLERDINEMKRLTGGSTGYFRKRIRLALAENARVEDVSLDYGGRKVQGRKVSIAPYVNDPMREKMQKYADKNYVFILSDAIPGAVYRISATVPDPSAAGAGKGAAALIEETMTFSGAKG